MERSSGEVTRQLRGGQIGFCNADFRVCVPLQLNRGGSQDRIAGDDEHNFLLVPASYETECLAQVAVVGADYGAVASVFPGVIEHVQREVDVRAFLRRFSPGGSRKSKGPEGALHRSTEAEGGVVGQ